MKRILVFILVIFTPLIIEAIPANELPFGADDLGDVSESSIAQLRDSLGFNIIKLGMPADNEVLERFLRHSIQPIVTTYWMDDEGAPEKWSYAHYAFMEVGDTNTDKDYRFYNEGSGGQFTNSTWVSTGADMLIGMDTYHYPPDPITQRSLCIIDKCYEGGYIHSGCILWNLVISLKLNSLVTDTTTLGWIEGWPAPWDADMMPAAPESSWTTINIGTITGAQFSRTDSFHNLAYQFTIPDMICYKKNNSADTLILPNNEPNGGGIGFNLRIHTTGAVDTLTVDWIKLYEEQGQKLATNDSLTIYRIKTFLQQHDSTSGDSNIYAWYMRDEPIFTNLDPIGKIDSLIRFVNPNWRHFTINNQAPMIRSYLSRTHSELIDMDYYPLGPSDKYAGWETDIPNQDEHGFQNRMNYMSGWLSFYRNRADEMGKQLWLTPQAF